MKFFFKVSIHNQELFETGLCHNFYKIPRLTKLLVFTKNNKIYAEEDLLLKITLCQFFFGHKMFLLIDSNKILNFRKFPIGGFVTIRKNLHTFLDFFFHIVLKQKKHSFFIKLPPIFLKFIITKNVILMKHFFRYFLFIS